MSDNCTKCGKPFEANRKSRCSCGEKKPLKTLSEILQAGRKPDRVDSNLIPATIDLSLNDVVWLYHHLNDCYQGLYRPNSLNTPYLERSMNALQNGMRRAFLLAETRSFR